MIDFAQLTVREQLGSGGQGRVYLATAAGGQRLALKLIELGESDATVKARLAALSEPHSGLLPILAHARAGELPGELRRQLPAVGPRTLILAMPFVDGAALSALGLLAPKETAAALVGIAKQLARLHPQIAHGDLRADNVLFDRQGDAVLIDAHLALEPRPADDLKALGEIGRELIGPESKPETEALRRLCNELDGGSLAPSAAEALDRLARKAIDLGAPAADLAAPLRLRVAATALKREEPIAALVTPPPPVTRGQPWRQWLKLVAGVVAAVAIIGGWELHQRGAVASTRVTTVAGRTVRLIPQGEWVKDDEGLMEIDPAEEVPSFALMTPTKDELLRLDHPKPGDHRYYGVTPGVYLTEMIRSTPQGLATDQKMVTIDPLHPFRPYFINRIISSPSPSH